MDLSMGALWAQMGWFVRGIVLVLIGMSVLTVAVAAAKWRRLQRMSQATGRFVPHFSAALEDDDLERALAVTRDHPDSHVATVLGQALTEVKALLDDPELAADGVLSAERVAEREQIRLASDLRRGLSTLATVGATAPFVGLLGTVIGIVNSFQGIARAGGGGLEAVSGGIAEALIATAIGLLAAIPAVWLYNYFTARLDGLFSELAYAARELVDWLLRREALRRRAAGARVSGTAEGV